VDLGLPAPLEHLGPDLHAGEIEKVPTTPEMRETMPRQ
jgi:hypothetical protein